MTSSSSPTPKLNRKSCELNEAGSKLLQGLIQKLSSQKRLVYSDIQTDANVNRTVVSNLLQGEPRGYQASTIKAVLECLQEKAQDLGYELSEKFDENKHCQNRISEPAEQPKVTQQPKRPQAIASSSEQKVVEALWDLDCAEQQADFDRLWPRVKRTSLITIQARGPKSQRWLVKRFARRLPRFSQARPFPIEVKAHPMCWDFQEFWNELARPFPEIASEPEAVLQKLCDCYQEQSVVIAMYGLANTKPKHLKAQRQQVVNEFWIPLCEKINELPTRSRQSRLVMFCTGEPDDKDQKAVLQGPSSEHALLLSKLETIDVSDIEDWLYRDSVYDSLCERRPDIERVITDELPDWDTTPDKVLDEIRCLFGNVDFESHWELAG